MTSQRIIYATAPIRIADNGGWTDTWFARQGKVFNIGVNPCAEVRIAVHEAEKKSVLLRAENFGEEYTFIPGENAPGRFRLLEAAIEYAGVPKNAALDITISSDAPAGASTGTSSSICVALIGALGHLKAQRMSARDVAYAAHHVEVDMLKNQCGVQDQLCAAYGGVNFIEITDFPRARVSRLDVSDEVMHELERRLVLIYLGKSHSSSAMHEKVIEMLENAGPHCRQLEDLRIAAECAREAFMSGDFAALGRSFIENTEAQGRLHPELISEDAGMVIESARAHGAAGWKVNGAGGPGGSVTVLSGPDPSGREPMVRAILDSNPAFLNIPVTINRTGLSVVESAS